MGRPSENEVRKANVEAAQAWRDAAAAKREADSAWKKDDGWIGEFGKVLFGTEAGRKADRAAKKAQATQDRADDLNRRRQEGR